jgi:hypothetical protein
MPSSAGRLTIPLHSEIDDRNALSPLNSEATPGLSPGSSTPATSSDTSLPTPSDYRPFHSCSASQQVAHNRSDRNEVSSGHVDYQISSLGVRPSPLLYEAKIYNPLVIPKALKQEKLFATKLPVGIPPKPMSVAYPLMSHLPSHSPVNSLFSRLLGQPCIIQSKPKYIPILRQIISIISMKASSRCGFKLYLRLEKRQRWRQAQTLRTFYKSYYHRHRLNLAE